MLNEKGWIPKIGDKVRLKKPKSHQKNQRTLTVRSVEIDEGEVFINGYYIWRFAPIESPYATKLKEFVNA